jgi:hypothetical protein
MRMRKQRQRVVTDALSPDLCERAHSGLEPPPDAADSLGPALSTRTPYTHALAAGSADDRPLCADSN